MTIQPIIRTDLDLQRSWQTLMKPLGFGSPSVWLLCLGPDDRPVPQLIELADADEPDDLAIEGLTELLRSLRVDNGVAQIAFLYSRPGDATLTDVDRRWAAQLDRASVQAGLPRTVVHLAGDDEIVPVPLDEMREAG